MPARLPPNGTVFSDTSRSRLPGGLRENICAENIRTGRDGEFPVPVAETPDF